MSILAWIVLGLIAGFIASKIVNKSGEGVFLDIVLGIVGAVVGGWLGHLVGGLNPQAGWLVDGLLQEIIVAYATLVVAGEYLNLASTTSTSGS